MERDARYLLKTVKVKLSGKTGVIVDYSNAHGLCFGIVYPNTRGHYGREESLFIEWFDPNEIEFV
jgi:hypothetical protein